jgi:hypothetical protein
MRARIVQITFLGLSVMSGIAYGHGGGLDSSGCHTRRSTGEYHCHRGGALPSAPGSRANQAAPQVAPEANDRICYVGPRGGRYRIVNGKKRYGC